MNWIFLALLALLFWIFFNYVDKYSLERYVKGIFDFLFFSTLTAWLFTPALVFLFGFPTLTWFSVVPILLGMALIYSYGFYGKALQEGETSRLVILFQLVPVLTLILAFLFFEQTISSKEFTVFFFVLMGAVIISVERFGVRAIFTKGAKWIMVDIVMWSVIFLIADFMLTKMSFTDFLILDTFGTALAGLPLLLIPAMRKQIVYGIKTAVPQKYRWFVLNNFFDFFGQMSLKGALSLSSSAGLVTVIIQVQSFYGIVLGYILTMVLPSIFREDTSKKALGKKIIGALIMFLGVALLLL